MSAPDLAAGVSGHEHREAAKADFEGKTIFRFEPDADNIWRFWFTDGTAFAVQCDTVGTAGLAVMELCDVCVDDDQPTTARAG